MYSRGTPFIFRYAGRIDGMGRESARGMNMGGMVSAEIGVRLVVPGEAPVPLAAGLFYTARDPYAIRVAFFVGGGERVEWTFARELLAAGLERAAGIGDVRVWPSPRPLLPGRRLLNLELSSPAGIAAFEIAARDIRNFLRRTCQIVPEAAESQHVDVEAGLRDLLREAL